MTPTTRDRALALLRKMEWAIGACTQCNRFRDQAHHEDCEWAAVVALLEAETNAVMEAL